MDYGLKMSFNDFQSLMFKWLFIGLVITFTTSMFMNLFNFTLTTGFYLITVIFSIIEIIFVLILAKKLHDLSYEDAKIYFIIYSIINGITISLLLSLVGPGIASFAFLMTGAYFGLLYTITKHTQYDFIEIGNICLCALPILLIAYLILMFIQAPVMYYVITIIDIVVFSGLTLYDMKKAERLYDQSPAYGLEAIALLCALELYLDFINIFIDILKLIDDYR